MEIEYRGHTLLIDEDDLPILQQRKWKVTKIGQRFYVVAQVDKRTTYLHRLIMNSPQGLVIDHINQNGLDNRKENLRCVKQRQNIINAGTFKSNSTGYRGVIVYRNGYRAQIMTRVNGRRFNISSYTLSDPIMAAQIWDSVVSKLYGSTAYQNKPNHPVSESVEKEASRMIDKLNVQLAKIGESDYQF